MIGEFLQSLFSNAPTWAKEQNLVRESIAIAARYQRQKSHWASHLINTQNEILKFKSENPEATKIGVFGSGHLFDFPQELLARPELEIYLFDAVHPRRVKQESYRARVHLIHCDLNMGREALVNQIGTSLKTCELFISTNLLSQLALGGSIQLAKKPEDREVYAQKLIENHLSFLNEFGQKTLLISDFEKKFVSHEGETILKETTLWNWDLAPIGEMSKQYRVELKVGIWK